MTLPTGASSIYEGGGGHALRDLGTRDTSPPMQQPTKAAKGRTYVVVVVVSPTATFGIQPETVV
jgi:hypothetical protein